MTDHDVDEYYSAKLEVLRAENERLQERNERLEKSLKVGWGDEREGIRAENERLREALKRAQTFVHQWGGQLDIDEIDAALRIDPPR